MNRDERIVDDQLVPRFGRNRLDRVARFDLIRTLAANGDIVACFGQILCIAPDHHRGTCTPAIALTVRRERIQLRGPGQEDLTRLLVNGFHETTEIRRPHRKTGGGLVRGISRICGGNRTAARNRDD